MPGKAPVFLQQRHHGLRLLCIQQRARCGAGHVSAARRACKLLGLQPSAEDVDNLQSWGAVGRQMADM